MWEQHVKHFAKAPEEDAAELQKYYESRDFVRRLDDEEEASESGSDVEGGSEPKRARAVPVVGAATAEQAKAPEPPTTVRSVRVALVRVAPNLYAQVLLALPTKKEAPKSLPIVVVKAAPKAKPAPAPAPTAPPAKPVAESAGLGLLSGYGSASD